MAPAVAAADGGNRRERLVGEAVAHAADLALATADVAGEIAQLAAGVVRECPPAMRPDAWTAVALAEAAACASARLVAGNPKVAADDPRRASAFESAHVAREARERTS